MKHNEPLQPTATAKSGPVMPNRTDLSLLYPKVKKAAGVEVVSDGHENQSLLVQPIIVNRVAVSLLLFIPVLATSLLVLFIYHNAAMYPPNPLASLQNFYATGVGLLLWALSFRSLAKRFEKCNISLSIFAVMYLFYLSPALKLTFSLWQGGSSGVVAALIILLTLTFFAVFYMTWALNRQATAYGRRMLIVALPVLVLTVSASLI